MQATAIGEMDKEYNSVDFYDEDAVRVRVDIDKKREILMNTGDFVNVATGLEVTIPDDCYGFLIPGEDVKPGLFIVNPIVESGEDVSITAQLGFIGAGFNELKRGDIIASLILLKKG